MVQIGRECHSGPNKGMLTCSNYEADHVLRSDQNTDPSAVEGHGIDLEGFNRLRQAVWALPFSDLSVDS